MALDEGMTDILYVKGDNHTMQTCTVWLWPIEQRMAGQPSGSHRGTFKVQRNSDQLRLKRHWVGQIFHSSFNTKARGTAIIIH